MKIAILYICTGKYTVFWEKFFTSCEKHFLLSHEKHYFVFTNEHITNQNNARVHRIEQAQLSWPDATLKRFHMFARIANLLEENFDFIVFFNANMIFLQEIGEEFLPSPQQQLVFHLHPGYFKRSRYFLPYERRRKSTAHIPYGKGEIYVCGGVNGGYTKPYLEMIHQLRNNIDVDFASGIIAKWHDESHINNYASRGNYKINSPEYAYPDKCNLPFPQKIRIIDKASVGGHAVLRGITTEKSKNLSTRFVFRPSFPKVHTEKPLVLSRLLGGLGNQMFIYATAYALAKRMGAELALDTGALQCDKIRNYELHNFALMDPQWRVPPYGDILLEKWATIKQNLGLGKTPWTFVHCPTSYDSRLKHLHGNCYLTGYWQSPHYFSDYATEIRTLFTCPSRTIPDLLPYQHYIQEKPTVAVHLRRGDYLDPKNISRHGILPLEYYEQARAWIEQKEINCQYLIFSDAPDAAQKNFSHWDNTLIFPGYDHVQDLMLMRQCKHAIIANSSYSWWGAWLGESGGQKVVAPRQWFAPCAQPPFNIADLFPAHWKCI